MKVPYPKISIITPSFNQGHYIERTIQSVLQQDYPNLEYLVVDGGSTDGTIRILKKYENQLKWISEKDRGQSYAINKGMHMASGDIVAFLNSDDTYEPGALITVGGFFAQNPNAVWVTGKCRIIDEQDKEIRRAVTFYKNLLLYLKSSTLLSVINFVSQPSTFWKREIIEELGDLDETLCYTMDYDYWLRIGQFYKKSFINRYLASFRMYNSSKSGANIVAEFEEQVKVTGRYSTSRYLKPVQVIHNFITVTIYERLMPLSKNKPIK